MKEWAKEELKYVDLGDSRRNCRLVKIVSDLAAQPEASVPQASGDWAGTKAVYEFWANRQVKAQAIRYAHQKATVERIKQHETILAIQDTTELNFTHHTSKKDLGHLDSITSRGLKVHSVFCASPQGVPLGLLNQKVWARDVSNIGKKHSRHKREIKEKESQRWLDSLSVTEEVIPENVTVVTVADREADIYEFLSQPRRTNSELLIRAYQNRSVRAFDSEQIEKMQSVIRKVDPVGTAKIELQKTAKRQARKATLTLRATSVEIQPPKGNINYSSLKPIKIQIILAEEENPPAGVAPVSWLLLTTLTVASFDDVVQCLCWYSYRWLIERYHYVLKIVV